jgi:hypothetical protein
MCARCPNYPYTLLHCISILTPSPNVCLPFFCILCEGPKKVLFLLPSPSCHVSCLRRIPPDPFPPLTSLFPFLNPLQWLCFTKSLFFHIVRENADEDGDRRPWLGWHIDAAIAFIFGGAQFKEGTNLWATKKGGYDAGT